MDKAEVISRLTVLLEQRKSADPEASYVARLYGKGREKIAQKVGEEAVELAIAAVGAKGDTAAMTSEAADLMFHMMVLLADAGLSLDDVFDELARREGLSGIDEKAARSGQPNRQEQA